MSKAKEHNLSVIILNPNQTSYIDEEEDILENRNEDLLPFYLSSKPLPHSSSKPIPSLSTSYEHILYAYDNIISKFSPAKKLYIVAHSAGGDNLMHLLRQREDLILSKLAKIAFIDSIHSISVSDTDEIKDFLKLNAIHFIASDKPMGEVIQLSKSPICREASAGHSKHEYTSGSCVNGVFDFFF
ncbi:unnamed protein product [Adineta steineri]|uniref:Arb2 domain-containing protein n=1 Tax=Adineta steineri TaxID=433720 RepID=A0A814I1W8_9BILA|nr:unnamed protein product [Adineta steineri]CAF3736292.1 unnamed protein product [Adineta steineri]